MKILCVCACVRVMLTFLVSRRLISDLSIRRSDSFLAGRQKRSRDHKSKTHKKHGEKGLNSVRRTEEGAGPGKGYVLRELL